MENKNWKEELLRCKNGYKDMSGEEYFFYNYFKINGKLPNKKTHPHKRFKEHREFLDLNKQKSLDEVDKMNEYFLYPNTPLYKDSCDCSGKRKTLHWTPLFKRNKNEYNTENKMETTCLNCGFPIIKK